MKQKAILIVSVVVGLLAFIMTNSYLQAERDKLYAEAEEKEVLAAAEELVVGTELKSDQVGWLKIYRRKGGFTEDYVLKGQEDRILNRKLLYTKKRNEPIRWSDIETEGVRTGLSPIIGTKPSMRAISIAISGEASVSGLVQPNDHVDILGTFTVPSRTNDKEMETVTMTLLQDVTVLATGTRLAKQEFEGSDRWRGAAAAGGGYSTVTFEVTPREAELLVFAQHAQGRLALSLRNPDDVKFERILPEVNFQHIEKNLPELNEYRQKEIRHKTNL